MVISFPVKECPDVKGLKTLKPSNRSLASWSHSKDGALEFYDVIYLDSPAMMKNKAFVLVSADIPPAKIVGSYDSVVAVMHALMILKEIPDEWEDWLQWSYQEEVIIEGTSSLKLKSTKLLSCEDNLKEKKAS